MYLLRRNSVVVAVYVCVLSVQLSLSYPTDKLSDFLTLSDIFQNKYVAFDELKYYGHTFKVMMCFE